MNVAVIGANGQLGREICRAFEEYGDRVTALTHEDIEVSSVTSVEACLQQASPEFIVNTAAMHHVEKCEGDPDRSFAVNGVGARNVARFAADAGIPVAYISTDYVFDGQKQSPYLESDAPMPLNTYGVTKLAGEQFTRHTNPRHFVLRVSGLYGHDPCRAKGGLNFVELMLKLSREREEIRVVDDEFVSPTPTVQVARQVALLSRTNTYGLYHATAEGSCTWYEFAREILDEAGAKVRLEKARPNEFPAKVPRPKYSVLENAGLNAISLNGFSHWRDGLRDYLRARS